VATIAPNAAGAPTPTGPATDVSAEPGADSLTEEQAVATARTHLNADQQDAELWRTLYGRYDEVDGLLGHRPGYVDQPEDESAARIVWGVEFRLAVEICPPGDGECETRPGLRTIFLDAKTGEWLRSSTFAPSPGDELPR
jgi:hypothetical protein